MTRNFLLQILTIGNEIEEIQGVEFHNPPTQ